MFNWVFRQEDQQASRNMGGRDNESRGEGRSRGRGGGGSRGGNDSQRNVARNNESNLRDRRLSDRNKQQNQTNPATGSPPVSTLSLDLLRCGTNVSGLTGFGSPTGMARFEDDFDKRPGQGEERRRSGKGGQKRYDGRGSTGVEGGRDRSFRGGGGPSVLAPPEPSRVMPPARFPHGQVNPNHSWDKIHYSGSNPSRGNRGFRSRSPSPSRRNKNSRRNQKNRQRNRRSRRDRREEGDPKERRKERRRDRRQNRRNRRGNGGENNGNRNDEPMDEGRGSSPAYIVSEDSDNANGDSNRAGQGGRNKASNNGQATGSDSGNLTPRKRQRDNIFKENVNGANQRNGGRSNRRDRSRRRSRSASSSGSGSSSSSRSWSRGSHGEKSGYSRRRKSASRYSRSESQRHRRRRKGRKNLKNSRFSNQYRRNRRGRSHSSSCASSSGSGSSYSSESEDEDNSSSESRSSSSRKRTRRGSGGRDLSSGPSSESARDRGDRSSSGGQSDSSRDDSVGHFRGGPGDLVGRYRIIRDVGMGTFGRVVQCEDPRSGWGGKRRNFEPHAVREGDFGTVAIKIVRNVRRYYDSALIEADICERVNRESKRQGKDLCARMLDRFTLSSGHYCLVFECLGRSLYDFLKKHRYRPFPMFCVRDFARQLLDTLDFLHGFGLIHTDLKPENILLAHNEETMYRSWDGTTQSVPVSTKVKIIDFGGATYDNEKKSSIVNTRQYRAPEVILGWGWSYPSDLWSAGCIIAELYAGELLFATHDNAEHLALMERAVGPFRKDLLDRSTSSLAKECFDSRGWHKIRGVLSPRSIEHVRKMTPIEQMISDHDRQTGLGGLLRSLLTIDPKQRANAREALVSPFFSQLS